jgi:hypothetical protein
MKIHFGFYSDAIPILRLCEAPSGSVEFVARAIAHFSAALICIERIYGDKSRGTVAFEV